GICAELLSGRVPYDLGFAIALGSVLALMCARPALALVLALITSAASPVAGAFLALAFLAWTLAVSAFDRSPGQAGRVGRLGRGWPVGQAARGTHPDRQWPGPLAPTLATLAPILILSLAFPEGGYEPFAPSSFWPALGGVLLIALLLPQGSLPPRGHRVGGTGAGAL